MTTWPAPELDGWTYAHNTIRLDEADLVATAARLEAQALAGEPIADWQLDALKTHWAICYGFIEEHHHNEEAHIFPVIDTKAKLPAKMTDDHSFIETQVKVIDALVKGLTPDRIAVLNSEARYQTMVSPNNPTNPRSTLKVNLKLAESCGQIKDEVMKLQACMDPHLAEEEATALPAMHSNFTPAEMKPVFDKMIGAMEWWALPHFYRQHKVVGANGARDWDRPAIRAHATGVLGMPGFVFDFIVFPTFRRYDIEYGWAIEESKDPATHGHFQARRRQVATWFRQTRKLCSRVSGMRGVLSGKKEEVVDGGAATMGRKDPLAPATLMGH